MKLADVKILVANNFVKHNMTDWNFKFDNAKSRFGLCSYKKKEISMSRHLANMNDIEKVNNNILHEIAHALVGTNQGHNRVWKRKAIEIGCNGIRLYDPEKINAPKGKCVYVCFNCGREVGYHKKLKRQRACMICCDKYNRGKFSMDYILLPKERVV